MQPVTIILRGVSAKGKQRLKEWGTEWVVLKTSEKVLFSSERGTWFFIVPSDIPTKNSRSADTGSRWIHSKQDRDFKILMN